MTRVSLRGMQLGIPTLRSGAVAPVNTVAPAIPASAVIGTELVTTPGTWTGATTLTYQWQRNTGSWVDISGATSANYTPVDADFGYALRVVETADGAVSANSNATGLTADVPSKSLGAEMVSDADMQAVNTAAWTPANSAVLTKEPDGTYTRVLRVNWNGVVANPIADQAIGSGFLELDFIGRSGDGVTSPRAITGGAFVFVGTTSTSAQRRRVLFSKGLNLRLYTSGSGYSEFISASAKTVTLNTQLTAPSANMSLTQLYTLPGSPENGSQMWLMPRISDFAAGNYWLALLEYTGSQWNITLYSVASNFRTTRITTVTNIGTTNGIRINADGDAITMYTTANSGTNWTQRGSTINNSLYQTATGVNSVWTSDFTTGELAFAPPF